MGLPTINITFSSLAVSAIQRSQRGIVALILKDSTDTTFSTKEYKAITDVKSSDWTATNLQYIKDAFLGNPSKIIVERLDTTVSDYAEALIRLGSKRWNWLAVPGIASGDVSDIATQVRTWRTNGKRFKAVLPNHAADHEAIVNFTTGGIKVGGSVYSASEYTSRIAGILAGLPLTRSATYFALGEVDEVIESADPDGDIDSGRLILINDEGSIKIGRGVNSLTTVTQGKSAEWQKIKIVEGMDLIQDDIVRTFNDEYVGKVNNNYSNQFLFITAINAYLSDLQDTVLDALADNEVFVDVEAQRQAWASVGTDVSDKTDDEVKEMSFQSKVFLAGKIKLLDAIEDLSISFSL